MEKCRFYTLSEAYQAQNVLDGGTSLSVILGVWGGHKWLHFIDGKYSVINAKFRKGQYNFHSINKHVHISKAIISEKVSLKDKKKNIRSKNDMYKGGWYLKKNTRKYFLNRWGQSFPVQFNISKLESDTIFPQVHYMAQIKSRKQITWTLDGNEIRGKK